MIDARTDAELLRDVRAGDRGAYEVLWRRHFGAGLRYARKMFPSRAEDLVSESFLAVYQQVTMTDKGPEFAFRSYLKAVIRNTSIRWHREADHVMETELPEQIDPRDGLSHVERTSDSADVLAAFEELPERWQRVLWLSEVAEIGRAQIATDLGIRPNAVSALQRRARHGMKLQWLTRQVPVLLREDDAHVARLLPRHLTEPRNAALAAEVTAHVVACDVCEDLLLRLRSSTTRVQGAALSAALLGAFGAGVPASASLSGGTAAAAAAVTTGSGVVAWLFAGGVTAATVGGLVLTSLFTVAPAASEPAETMSAPAPAASAPPPAPAPSAPALLPHSVPEAIGIAEPLPVTGRNNPDPSIPTITLVNDPDQPIPGPPSHPETAGPGVPDPATDPGTAPSPGMTTPTTSAGYLAPAIAGSTAPGSSVAIELDSQRYTPAVAEDGSWSFDPRGLELAAGTYDYQVWAYDATTQSAPTTGSFTVLPIVVQGFEGVTGYQDMLVDEAQTTGLVIALTGPANGTVFVSTMEGHTAFIPLDETGHALQRLRMDSRGWYYFTFRALDADGFWGPGTEKSVDVYDPDVILDPWGPDPEGMTFEFTEP